MMNHRGLRERLTRLGFGEHRNGNPATLQVFALLWEAPSPKACVTRWLITPHPADLSRIMQQRLVQEYVPFAAPCLNSHSVDEG